MHCVGLVFDVQPDCCRDLNYFYENDKVTFEEKCCLYWAELRDALELDRVARGVIGISSDLNKKD